MSLNLSSWHTEGTNTQVERCTRCLGVRNVSSFQGIERAQ